MLCEFPEQGGDWQDEQPSVSKRQDDGHGMNLHPCAIPAHVQTQIRRLYRQGMSYRMIQRLAGVSARTVWKYLKPLRGEPMADMDEWPDPTV